MGRGRGGRSRLGLSVVAVALLLGATGCDPGVEGRYTLTVCQGGAWHTVAIGTPPVQEGDILLWQSMLAFSSSDVTVVGMTGPQRMKLSAFDEDGQVRLVNWHWDGSAWRLTPGPDIAPAFYREVTSVSGTSGSDVWATVVAVPTSGQPIEQSSYVFHWDGLSWSEVGEGPAASEQEVLSIVAVSPRDAWAVGDRIEHFDGRSWEVVRPSPFGEGARLRGM
jgi:hypothetical protein